MEISWEVVASLVAGIGAVVIRHLLRTRGARNRIKNDLEILSKMPAGAARESLEAYISRQVENLVRRSSEERRDWFGVSLGVSFLVLGTWFAINGMTGSDLWFLPAIFFLLFGVVGTVESTMRRRRDEQGRAIES